MLRHVLNFYIDPHVKVEGKRDNVMEAKKRILEVLETKVSAIWNTINNKRFLELYVWWKKLLHHVSSISVCVLSR